jgi:hypothetical protein
LVAVVIAVLSLGGWVYTLSKPALRATLGTQTAAWWFEQGIILLQALACLAFVRGVGRASRPASILTGAALLITTLAWVQGMQLTGRHPIPITPILNALLLWRLWRATSLDASERLAA